MFQTPRIHTRGAKSLPFGLGTHLDPLAHLGLGHIWAGFWEPWSECQPEESRLPKGSEDSSIYPFGPGTYLYPFGHIWPQEPVGPIGPLGSSGPTMASQIVIFSRLRVVRVHFTSPNCRPRPPPLATGCCPPPARPPAVIQWTQLC